MGDYKKVLLDMDKYYVYITKVTGEKVRYDLKNLVLQRPSKTTISGWKTVQHQYKFFEDLSLYNIEYKKEKFKKMLTLACRLKPDCESVSTYLTYIPKMLVYEPYFEEGLDIEVNCRTGYCYGGGKYYSIHGVKQPLSIYDKNIVKIFKKYNLKITKGLEEMYMENKELTEQIIRGLDNCGFTDEEYGRCVQNCFNNRSFDNLKILVKEYNFDISSLLKYINCYLVPFEALTFYDSLDYICDYYRMSKAIGRKVKKYPKYLRSTHDIITANYNSFKKEYDEVLFTNISKPELEFKDDKAKFCITIPKSSKDIVKEGTSLNHCVSSYVDRVLEQRTYIMFLRNKKSENESLVTLELRDNTIVQAKGHYNRSISDEERVFLEKYCKKKELTMEV